MGEERCPHCGCIAYPDEPICDECGRPLSRGAPAGATSDRPPRPTVWQVAWPLAVVAMLVFHERAIALLKLPLMTPLAAATILAIGLPKAWSSRRPRISLAGVIASALVLLCVWLRPVFPLSWIPSTLPVVMLILVMLVLPEAETFRDPEWFRLGVFTIAGTVSSFWPVQAFIARLELGFREYNIALHGLALFFWVCMFMVGIQFLVRASAAANE